MYEEHNPHPTKFVLQDIIIDPKSYSLTDKRILFPGFEKQALVG